MPDTTLSPLANVESKLPHGIAQPGPRYFMIRQNADNGLIARFDAHTDKLNLFLWNVGGLAASGTRR